jgi:DNA-binding NtrC family response regulator
LSLSIHPIVISEGMKQGDYMKQQLNILVVDDEKEICRLLFKFLSSEGHRVKTAISGREAINLIKKENFDYVFLDILMPGISGEKALEKIKQISPKIKVIMITGSLLIKAKLDRLRQLGASEFLHKPFKIENILEIIKIEN